MRLSQFWDLMGEEFGTDYAPTLAHSHVMSALGERTAAEALEAGVAPRTIWLALCTDFDVPPERRLGKDHPPRR